MNIYIDIDNTICITDQNLGKDKYIYSKPIYERIEKVNKLYAEGNTITYWTARGSVSKENYEELTRKQLEEWGCKYHNLLLNKPSYDKYIDDKSFNVDSYWPLNKLSDTKKVTSSIVKKGWGHEIIIININTINNRICYKYMYSHRSCTTHCKFL